MVFISKIFMDLLLWILNFLDTIFDICGILAGIEGVNDEGITLIDVFLRSDIVTQIFLGLILLGIVISAVCIVVAIIKHTINLSGGERKPHGRTVGQGIAAVFATLILAIVMVAGIGLANTALTKIHNLFMNAHDASTLGTIIFEMSVEDSYTIIGTIEDEEGNTIGYIYADEKESGWYAGGVPDGFTIKGKTAEDIFGQFESFFGFEDGKKPVFIGGTIWGDAGTPTGIIKYDSFNFFVAYFAAIILLVSMSLAMLGLVKRLYDLVLLFLALPLVSATLPLDDGAKLKLWRETVVSKVILAYGVIFSLNVFLIITKIVQGINISTIGSNDNPFLETVFRLFLIVGGGLSISGGQLLFARLFGTSAEESREMTQSFRSLMAGTMAAGGLARAAKNTLIGGRNKFGVEQKGVLPFAGKAAKGAANATGNLLGGNAYRRSTAAAGASMSKLSNILRGSTNSWRRDASGQAIKPEGTGTSAFMQGGGLIGGAIGAVKTAKIKADTRQGLNEYNFAQRQAENGVIIPPTKKTAGFSLGAAGSGNIAGSPQGTNPSYSSENTDIGNSPNLGYFNRHATVTQQKVDTPQSSTDSTVKKPRKSNKFYKEPKSASTTKAGVKSSAAVSRPTSERSSLNISAQQNNSFKPPRGAQAVNSSIKNSASGSSVARQTKTNASTQQSQSKVRQAIKKGGKKK